MITASRQSRIEGPDLTLLDAAAEPAQVAEYACSSLGHRWRNRGRGRRRKTARGRGGLTGCPRVRGLGLSRR